MDVPSISAVLFPLLDEFFSDMPKVATGIFSFSRRYARSVDAAALQVTNCKGGQSLIRPPSCSMYVASEPQEL